MGEGRDLVHLLGVLERPAREQQLQRIHGTGQRIGELFAAPPRHGQLAPACRVALDQLVPPGRVDVDGGCSHHVPAGIGAADDPVVGEVGEELIEEGTVPRGDPELLGGEVLAGCHAQAEPLERHDDVVGAQRVEGVEEALVVVEPVLGAQALDVIDRRRRHHGRGREGLGGHGVGSHRAPGDLVAPLVGIVAPAEAQERVLRRRA